jgi:hypothetical protein
LGVKLDVAAGMALLERAVSQKARSPTYNAKSAEYLQTIGNIRGVDPLSDRPARGHS